MAGASLRAFPVRRRVLRSSLLLLVLDQVFNDLVGVVVDSMGRLVDVFDFAGLNLLTGLVCRLGCML